MRGMAISSASVLKHSFSVEALLMGSGCALHATDPASCQAKLKPRRELWWASVTLLGRHSNGKQHVTSNLLSTTTSPVHCSKRVLLFLRKSS